MAKIQKKYYDHLKKGFIRLKQQGDSRPSYGWKSLKWKDDSIIKHNDLKSETEVIIELGQNNYPPSDIQ